MQYGIRIKQLSYALLKAGIVAASIGTAGIAHALSLGELQIRSGLGQPFVGVVPYTTARGDDVHSMCIRTRYVQGPPTSGVPELADPRIEVEPGRGGGNIIVRTSRPVDEPIVRLYLAINCGPSVSMNREFMVALDPPRTDLPVPRPGPGITAADGAAGQSSAARRAVPPAPASGAGSTAAAGSEAGASARAQREEQRLLRRSRAGSNGAPAAGGTPVASSVLPYEPGVTPPPGRRGTRAEQAAAAAPKYRLSLSRPGSDEPNPTPMLRGSESLDSLARPEVSGITAEQREKLRNEWRARTAADPLLENQKMQDDVGRLGTSLRDLKAQLDAIQKERAGERDSSAKRIAQLEEDKRSLSTWLNGLALALGFVGCVAVAALLFWSYRRRAEQKGVRERRLMADDVAATPVAERHEPGIEEEFDNTPWRPEDDAPAVPATMPAPPSPKPARRIAGAATPAAGAAAPVARIATPRPTPPAFTKPTPAAKPVGSGEDDSYTVTVELPAKAGAPPPVEDFYANPPRGADDKEFSLDDAPPEPVQAPLPPTIAPITVAPALEIPPDEPIDLPAISFELPKPGAAEEAAMAAAKAPPAAPDVHGDVIEFSLDGMPPLNLAPVSGSLPPAPPAASAPAASAPAGQVDDPFGNDPAPPPPPSLGPTFVPPLSTSEPTPTLTRMKALVDEIATAHLSEPAEPQVPSTTGVHRTLDIDLGGDGDSEMRAQLYRQEFELKLFPEIVHGQAKLKVPQSIISLARTYYQEDFDTNRAINLLEYAADRTPDPQRVRLALLEILRMEGMAREYVAVSHSFRSLYPDAEEWETVAAYGKLLVPEEPLFKDADATGYDLNMPSMWLGSTLDMTRYVLAQDLHDAMHGPVVGVREEA